MPKKTSTDRVRAFRKRKRAQRPPKQAPKSALQRLREFRERRKALKKRLAIASAVPAVESSTVDNVDNSANASTIIKASSSPLFKLPVTCAVNGCKAMYTDGSSIQFFHFPLNDGERCKLWINATKQENWTPSERSMICSRHFAQNDYLDRPNTYTKRLKLDAVPSLLLPSTVSANPIHFTDTTCSNKQVFCSTEDLQKCEQMHNEILDIKTEFVKCEPTEMPSAEYYVLPLDPLLPIMGREMAEYLTDEHRKTKEEFDVSPRKKKLRAKLKMLQQKVQHQREKLDNISQLLDELQDKVDQWRGGSRQSLNRASTSIINYEEIRLNGKLHVIVTGTKRDCKVCSCRNKPSGRHQTTYYCDTCPDKPRMHLGECFINYHTKEKYRI